MPDRKNLDIAALSGAVAGHDEIAGIARRAALPQVSGSMASKVMRCPSPACGAGADKLYPLAAQGTGCRACGRYWDTDGKTELVLAGDLLVPKPEPAGDGGDR